MVAKQADHDRNMLSRKFAIQTHKAMEIESRFRRIADLAPVSMFHIDPSGVLLYANEYYYAYAGLPVEIKIDTNNISLCRLTELPRDGPYAMVSDIIQEQ